LSDKGVIYYLDCLLGFSLSPLLYHYLSLTRQHFFIFALHFGPLLFNCRQSFLFWRLQSNWHLN